MSVRSALILIALVMATSTIATNKNLRIKKAIFKSNEQYEEPKSTTVLAETESEAEMEEDDDEGEEDDEECCTEDDGDDCEDECDRKVLPKTQSKSQRRGR